MITLGNKHAGNLSGRGRLYFGFHLHGLDDQHRIAGLNLVTFLHQHIHDVAGHACGYMTFLGGGGPATTGPRALAVFSQRSQVDFLRHPIDGHVETTLILTGGIGAGDVNIVALTMNRDLEFAGDRAARRTGGNRLQGLRLQRTVTPLLKIRFGLIREHGVREHILFAGGQFAHLFAQLVEFTGDQVSGAFFNQILLADGALLKRFINRSRRLAVPALEVLLHLVRDGLVALAGKHVDHRLGTHDLGGGCYQRRVTKILSNPRNFLEYVLDAI